MANRQHISMEIAFGLTAFLAILIHYEFKFVPKGRSAYAKDFGMVIVIDHENENNNTVYKKDKFWPKIFFHVVVY